MNKRHADWKTDTRNLILMNVVWFSSKYMLTLSILMSLILLFTRVIKDIPDLINLSLITLFKSGFSILRSREQSKYMYILILHFYIIILRWRKTVLSYVEYGDIRTVSSKVSEIEMNLCYHIVGWEPEGC